MKKFFVLAFAAVSIIAFSCQNASNTETTETTEVATETTEVAQPTVVSTFEGLVPSASGSGYQTKLELLDDNTFVISEEVEHQGEVNKFDGKGSYMMNADTLTLTFEDQSVRTYLQVVDTLKGLDADKKVDEKHLLIKK